MTNTENLADVEVLLAERDAVAGWLNRLDEAGSTVPPAVRDRVRLDYQLRMDGVTHRLKGHSETINAKLTTDRAEQQEHTASQSAAQDALAEAELRHLVGEFDTDRFKTDKARHTADISRCTESLAEVSQRVANLEELLALIVAPPGKGGMGITDRVERTEPDDEVIAEVEQVLEDADEGDEEDHLLAVFDEAEEEETTAEFEIELVDSEEEDEASDASSDRGPLSFRPGSGMPNDKERVIPSFGMPADVPARFTPAAESVRPTPTPAPTRPTPTPTSPPASAPVQATSGRRSVFEEEIVAAGPRVDPVPAPIGRTARCGECGATNRASEWYCEKCGAELTIG